MGKQGRIEDVLPLEEAVNALRAGDRPVEPFHWEIEFPEVFGRPNGGFDAMLGNPPFFWGNRISRVFGEPYRDWLLLTNEATIGSVDLVIYFLRRAFLVIAGKGTIGYVATNSIAETDTRAAGLDFIVRQGGSIFAAHSDLEWPGEAGVRISVVHIAKSQLSQPCILNGVTVEAISAALQPTKKGADNEQPVQLQANASRSFKGVDFGGDGFLLSTAEYETITCMYPNELRFVLPVLNAQDFTSSVSGILSRHIINFTGYPLEEVRNAQYCIGLIEDRVKPMRDKKKGKERELWWQFRRAGGAYSSAVEGLKRVLVGPVVAKFLSFAFFPHRVVFTNAINIFAFDTFASFCVLQSRVHEMWALRYASTLRTDTRYNPSDCFETFPFPANFEESERLEAVGKEYYDFRAQLMIANNEGLTKTYNRFHDPHERSPEIKKLRELHDAMDRAVLDAYGWTDLVPTREFLLDYDEDDDDEDGLSRRKKPWRYRWPDEFRDEVLARLLDLNQQRAEEERLTGLAAAQATHGKAQGTKGKTRKKLTRVPEDASLFGVSSGTSFRNQG